MLKTLPLILLCCSGCTHMAQDQWTGRDKAQHFISSAFLTAAGNAYGERQNWGEGHSARFGLTFAITLGAAKEFYDSREGGDRLELEGFCLGHSRRNHRLCTLESGPVIRV